MEIKLTKEADKLLLAAYHEYLSRRRAGLTRSNSRCFADGYWSTRAPFDAWLPGDLYDVECELVRKGLLARHITGETALKDDAIAILEDRFSDGLKSLTSYISQLIPQFIP